MSAAKPHGPASSDPWFVAVGASGSQGLGDIKTLLHAMPPSLNAVVLIVLHRPWDCISHLREVLAHASRLPVVIAAQGEHFEPGMAYVGEPADHLALAADSFGTLISDPDRRYRNRTVDLLLSSLAAHGGSRIIGVILSGSLDDGSRGLAAIHHAGGLTMALKPSGSAVHGMAENAIAYDGPIDAIGSPGEIARAIAAAVRSA